MFVCGCVYRQRGHRSGTQKKCATLDNRYQIRSIITKSAFWNHNFFTKNFTKNVRFEKLRPRGGKPTKKGRTRVANPPVQSNPCTSLSLMLRAWPTARSLFWAHGGKIRKKRLPKIGASQTRTFYFFI